MRRSTLLNFIALFALAPVPGISQGESPRPPYDLSASARANPEFGAADDPQLLEDPAYRETWKERTRQRFRAMYPDVGRALQLAPTEEQGLIELLVTQQLEGILQPSAPGKSSLEQMSRREQELATYLGPERLQAWQSYQMTAARRGSAEQWREQIGGPDLLSDEQVDALARIQEQAQEETRQPGPPPAGFPAITDHSPEAMRARQAYAHQLTEQRDARMLELAAPYLSARQLAALDAILARHRFWQKPGAQPSSNSSAGARKL